MSRFPKSARHPVVSSVVDKWSSVRDSINVEQEVHLSEFPELAIGGGRVRNVEYLEYFGAAREVVGANAIRALAKSYEALDGSSRCGEKGVTMAAIVQAYSSSFFAARGFCMLMGFSPLDRDSAITLDAFSEEVRKTRRSQVASDLLRLHKYKRWGHDEVWSLTKRLVDTMHVPEVLSEAKEGLRIGKLDQSSRLRNSFQYDDSALAPDEIRNFVDFPDRKNLDLFGEHIPPAMRHNYIVTRRLLEVCSFIIREVQIGHLLHLCLTKARIESGSDWGSWG